MKSFRWWRVKFKNNGIVISQRHTHACKCLWKLLRRTPPPKNCKPSWIHTFIYIYIIVIAVSKHWKFVKFQIKYNSICYIECYYCDTLIVWSCCRWQPDECSQYCNDALLFNDLFRSWHLSSSFTAHTHTHTHDHTPAIEMEFRSYYMMLCLN